MDGRSAVASHFIHYGNATSSTWNNTCPNRDAKSAKSLGLNRRLEFARRQLAQVIDESFLAELVGTLGTDPMNPIEGISPPNSPSQTSSMGAEEAVN